MRLTLSACVWLLAAGFGVNGAQFETGIHDTVRALLSLGCACKGAQAKTAVFTGHALRVRFFATAPSVLCMYWVPVLRPTAGSGQNVFFC